MRILRAVPLSLFGLCVFAWPALYFDSLHQRSRAEHLISELKSFPFSSAGFAEGRSLAARYGGVPVERPSISQIPVPGAPEQEGKRCRIPLRERGCSMRGCDLEIWIMPHILSLWPRPVPQRIFSALSRVGLRPWGLSMFIAVEDGGVLQTVTTVAQVRHAGGAPDGLLIPLGYEVKTSATMSEVEPDHKYVVGPEIEGRVVSLHTEVPQKASSRVQRAFDIDLSCFTLVTRACKGVDELAPAAWAEFENLAHQPR